jgi:hypothetical protein
MFCLLYFLYENHNIKVSIFMLKNVNTNTKIIQSLYLEGL